MRNQVTQTATHPVVYAIRTFIEKLRQHPESYPIKYYKKYKAGKKRRPFEFVK